MIDFRKQQVKEDGFSPDFNILMDVHNVKFHGKSVEVNEYVRFYQENKSITGERRIAVLTDTPNQVFFITLFEQYNDQLSQRTKVFSTVETALMWLHAGINSKQASQILDNLRKSVSGASSS